MPAGVASQGNHRHLVILVEDVARLRHEALLTEGPIILAVEDEISLDLGIGPVDAVDLTEAITIAQPSDLAQLIELGVFEPSRGRKLTVLDDDCFLRELI